MTIADLFTMQPGEAFVVYWAKDDDPEKARFDYDRRTVRTNDGSTLVDSDGDDWINEPGSVPDPADNLYDTSRGYAYFYRA